FEPRAQVAVSARQYDARRESRSQPQTTGKRGADGNARGEKSGATRGGEQTGDRTEHGPAPGRAQLHLDSQRVRDLLPQAVLTRRERERHGLSASRRRSEQDQRCGERAGDTVHRHGSRFGCRVHESGPPNSAGTNARRRPRVPPPRTTTTTFRRHFQNASAANAARPRTTVIESTVPEGMKATCARGMEIENIRPTTPLVTPRRNSFTPGRDVSQSMRRAERSTRTKANRNRLY